MGVGVAPISVIELTKNKQTKWMGDGEDGEGGGVWAELSLAKIA